MTTSRDRAGEDVRFFADGATFELPEPVGLLPWRCHPESDEIAAQHVDWVRTQLRPGNEEQLAEVLAGQHHMWVSLGFPTALADRAQVVARLTTLLFTVDDMTSHPTTEEKADEATAQTQAIFDVLLSIVRGDDVSYLTGGHDVPLLSVAIRLFDSLRTGMTVPQWERFVRCMESYAAASVGEMAPRTDHVTIAFDDVLALRVASSGTEPYLIMLEYTLGIDLGDVRTPEIQRIEDTASAHVTLVNDLHSFRAEHYKGDDVNTVAVGCLVDGLSLQASIDRVCDQISEAERSFVRQREAILAGELGRRADVRAYMAALGYGLAGNARWSHLTPRYHGIEHRWNGRTHGTVTLLPDRTVLCE